ncbi:unnamed protein product [Didymodactylos carnosus]|uniref:Uncharacterized protein n=1 Tax=Didymodactylos carnosus TaxID=1234261 RepID=A0A8S2XC18_9BILA|nr:unnamed protein product [Didymodactylos carnosus]
MLLWLVGNVNPSALRESIKHETFRDHLIQYLEDITKEDLSCFQTEQVRSDVSEVEKPNRTLTSICAPMPTPEDLNFEEKKRMAICTLVAECPMHRHTGTCYKYANTSSANIPPCRMRF